MSRLFCYVDPLEVNVGIVADVAEETCGILVEVQERAALAVEDATAPFNQPGESSDLC